MSWLKPITFCVGSSLSLPISLSLDPTAALCLSSEWIPVLHCSLGIPFSQQLSPTEPTEMFLLQFPSLAIKTSVRLSRGPDGSSLLWLAREQSACGGYRVRPKRGAEGPGLESASCGRGESAVCGSVANTRRSTSSCSNRTRRGEPGPPRCS